MGWAIFTTHPQPWGLPCILISELGRISFPFGVRQRGGARAGAGAGCILLLEAISVTPTPCKCWKEWGRGREEHLGAAGG